MATGEHCSITCDVVHACLGALNKWQWPDIPGLHSFEGELMHSAKWNAAWDAKVSSYRHLSVLSNTKFAEKRQGRDVAVIGSGSSAIQIVPQLQPRVRRLYNYVRGRLWISPPFGAGELHKQSLGASNCTYRHFPHFPPVPDSTQMHLRLLNCAASRKIQKHYCGTENKLSRSYSQLIT